MRLFFALWPEDRLAASLAEVAAECTKRFGGRKTRATTIHMTLAFLGEQPTARFPDIVAAARSIRWPPFSLTLDRLGAWPRNRLLWAGCLSPPDELLALADSLHAALRQTGVSFEDAKRRFVPHVTLARKLPENSFPLELPVFQARPWHCTHFVLVESRLSAGGADYRVVDTFGGQ